MKKNAIIFILILYNIMRVSAQSAEKLYWQASNTKNKIEELDLYNKSISKSPNVSCPYFRRGIIHFYNKNYNEAISDFQNSINLNNWKYSGLYYSWSLRDAYGFLIASLLNLQKYTEAIPFIDEGIKLIERTKWDRDSFTDFYGYKIKVLLVLQKYHDALDLLNTYSNPKYGDQIDYFAGYQIVKLEIEARESIQDYNGVLTKTIPKLESYSKLDNSTPKPHYYDFLKGKFKYLMGSYKRAIEDLNRSISAENNYPLAYYYRSLAKLKIGEIISANEDIDEAILMDPNNTTFKELKDQILLKENTNTQNSSISQMERGNATTQTRFENENIVKPSGKYYAILIGVSNYENAKLNLLRPETDAQALMKVLTTNYLFDEKDITFLKSPTRGEILGELYKLRKSITPNDNLLIFYAGHGFWDQETKQGYWWPKDGQADNPANWLSNSDLVEQIRAIKSGHTLLISDACFSGGIFKQRDVSSIKSANLSIQLLYKLPSRRAMTSTSLTKVNDDSEFMKFLLKRLTENNSPFLTSEQLFDSLKQAVISNSANIPQDGEILNTGHEGGDFVFIKRN